MAISLKEWAAFRRLLTYTRPYLGRLAVGLVFGMIFGGSMTALLLSGKKLLASVFNPAEMTMEAAVMWAIALPLVGLVRGAGDYLSTYYVEWVGNRVVMDLRNATFSHLLDLSLQYFTKSRTGELISRTINDTMLVERAVSSGMGDLAKQPFAFFGAAGFLIWLDPQLAFIGLVLFPLCIIPVAAFGKKIRRFAREGQQKVADLMSILQEATSGIRIVKAFRMEDHERARFGVQCKAVFGRAMRVTKARASVEPIIVTISFLGLSLVLLYTRWVHMSVDHFFSFAAAMVAMYEPVKKLSKIHLGIQHCSGAADRIFEVLDAPVTVGDRPGAAAFDQPPATIEFDDVGFAYDSEPVLKGIRLRVAAGQCIALVGSSGSGKTTMVSLLPRFFDVTSGRILINGVDIRDMTLRSLRNLIGIVTQDTFLFNDTVASNIAYGREQAPRAAIEDAAQRARAHDFIMAMPQGYDTVIGERGVRLSGGQCQRLAIARAILRNPPILILDEATSALDTESERQVQAALNDLMSGRTVFAIAHRLSTVTHADRILVLDGGRIAEEGSHQELLARDGLYKFFHNLQFGDAASGNSLAAGPAQP